MNQPAETLWINDEIIFPVFQELVSFHPRLNIFLTDDDGETDSHELFSHIRSKFPCPIAEEFRRLMTDKYDDRTHARLYQILKTVERAMQFSTFVLLSQLLDEVKGTFNEGIPRSLSIPDDFRNNFRSRIGAPTLGDYTWLLQSMGKIFRTNGIEPFVPEMEILTSKRFGSELEPWAKVRNDIQHYSVNVDRAKVQEFCDQFQKGLTHLLSKLCFFTKYPLVAVTNISVNKRKWAEAAYCHSIKRLPKRADKPQTHSRHTDSHSVLFLRNPKNLLDGYLNLSPFIVDTHTEKLDTEEKRENIKMDIFLYHKYQNDRIHYAGTKVTEKCDLRSLSYYPSLVDELHEYFNAFGTEA